MQKLTAPLTEEIGKCLAPASDAEQKILVLNIGHGTEIEIQRRPPRRGLINCKFIQRNNGFLARSNKTPFLMSYDKNKGL